MLDILQVPVEMSVVNQIGDRLSRLTSMNCWILKISFLSTSIFCNCFSNAADNVRESAGFFKVKVCCLKKMRTALGNNECQKGYGIFVNILKRANDFRREFVPTPHR